MTINTFLILLTAFSVVNSGVVEIIKTTFGEKCKHYNLIALVTGMVIGVFGLYTWGHLTDGLIRDGLLYILMGLATAGTSMLGYDKVKQMIEQFNK